MAAAQLLAPLALLVQGASIIHRASQLLVTMSLEDASTGKQSDMSIYLKHNTDSSDPVPSLVFRSASRHTDTTTMSSAAVPHH